jgi:hypothetical protein
LDFGNTQYARKYIYLRDTVKSPQIYETRIYRSGLKIHN